MRVQILKLQTNVSPFVQAVQIFYGRGRFFRRAYILKTVQKMNIPIYLLTTFLFHFPRQTFLPLLKHRKR